MLQRHPLTVRHAPQVLCLGLATALGAANGGAAWRGVPMEVGGALLGGYVRGRENSGVVLRRLWAEPAARELVTRAVAASCEEHDALAAHASRALDIFQARLHAVAWVGHRACEGIPFVMLRTRPLCRARWTSPRHACMLLPCWGIAYTAQGVRRAFRDRAVRMTTASCALDIFRHACMFLPCTGGHMHSLGHAVGT